MADYRLWAGACSSNAPRGAGRACLNAVLASTCAVLCACVRVHAYMLLLLLMSVRGAACHAPPTRTWMSMCRRPSTASGVRGGTGFTVRRFLQWVRACVGGWGCWCTPGLALRGTGSLGGGAAQACMQARVRAVNRLGVRLGRIAPALHTKRLL